MTSRTNTGPYHIQRQTLTMHSVTHRDDVTHQHRPLSHPTPDPNHAFWHHHRPNTRDEIYCQIFKQIVNNPNRYSQARCWIMLALCSSVFLPSKKFEATSRHFIKGNGPPGYLPYLMRRFARSETAFEPRLCPPTALEVHAAFTGKPIQIRVHFYFTSMVRCNLNPNPDPNPKDQGALLLYQHGTV
jgi:hypothetical protein